MENLLFTVKPEHLKEIDLPPVNSLMASAKASMDSMSKLFVGSSYKQEVETQYCKTVPNYSESINFVFPLTQKEIALTRMSMSGFLQARSAKATLDFCPPDRSFIIMVCA